MLSDTGKLTYLTYEYYTIFFSKCTLITLLGIDGEGEVVGPQGGMQNSPGGPTRPYTNFRPNRGVDGEVPEGLVGRSIGDSEVPAYSVHFLRISRSPRVARVLRALARQGRPRSEGSPYKSGRLAHLLWERNRLTQKSYPGKFGGYIRKKKSEQLQYRMQRTHLVGVV